MLAPFDSILHYKVRTFKYKITSRLRIFILIMSVKKLVQVKTK